MEYIWMTLAAVGGVLLALLLVALVRTLLLPKKSTEYKLGYLQYQELT